MLRVTKYIIQFKIKCINLTVKFCQSYKLVC